MTTINTLEEAKKFHASSNVGDAWSFGGWPDPIIDEDPEEYEKTMAAAVALEADITEIINAPKQTKTLEQIKDEYTMVEMRKLAKDNCLSGYSSLREDDLIEFLISNGVVL